MRRVVAESASATKAGRAFVQACRVLLAVVLLSTVARAQGIAGADPVAETPAIQASASQPGTTLLVAPALHWRERFTFDEKFQLSDQLSLALETDLADRRERLLAENLGVDPAALLLWERKTVGGTTIKLGALGGRLRLTTRYGWSRYDDSTSNVDAFASFGDLGASWSARRSRAHDPDIGQAFAQDLAASVWSSSNLGVSLFGGYRQVDASFVTEDHAGEHRKGLFSATPGRKLEYGGKLRLGPVQLTLAQEESRAWQGEDHEHLGPRHRVARASATLSLHGLRERAGNALGKPMSQLLPGSVWVSVAEGKLAADGERSVDDATRDTLFGMSWSGTSWSMNLDYWRSVYENRQPGSEGADWIGDGAYLGWGYYAERWDVYLTAGFSRSANMGRSSRSVDLNLDGSLTVGVRPEHLPDLVTSFSYGGYSSDYRAWDAESRTRSLSVGASLDFTKFLRSAPLEDGPALRVAYRFAANHTHDDFAGFSEAGEHSALLFVELPF
jgi:hypothetical protein